MKKAVIMVGKHHAGKSVTINEHLKPLLKIKPDAHKFTLDGKRGYILSQSFEESGHDVIATIKKYFNRDLLVLAARPDTEPGSKLELMRDALTEASFTVYLVFIQSPDEAPKKADEIFKILKS